MSYEHLTPAERRRWGMFEVVRAAFKAGMLPVEQDLGKVAIFERPIQRAPYIAVAVPNFDPACWMWRREIDPMEISHWAEHYEAVPVYLQEWIAPDDVLRYGIPPHRYIAYATSREELDRFFARRNAEEARKRDPIVRNGEPPLDTWVVGETTALVRRR